MKGGAGMRVVSAADGGFLHMSAHERRRLVKGLARFAQGADRKHMHHLGIAPMFDGGVERLETKRVGMENFPVAGEDDRRREIVLAGE